MYKLLYLPTAQFVNIVEMGTSFKDVSSWLKSNYIKFYLSPSSKEVDWIQCDAANTGKLVGELPKHLFEIVEVINVSNG